MHIGFSINDLKSREVTLAHDFVDGLKRFNHSYSVIKNTDSLAGLDLLCVIGVKSMHRMVEAKTSGLPFIYFDKGYSRKEGYWRIAINDHQPTGYFCNVRKPDDRRIGFGWNPKPWNSEGNEILFAGSSEKFHEFKGLDHPTKYAEKIVSEISKASKRRIIYRPKPSWRGATHIRGTVFDQSKGIRETLKKCYVMVTYGSNSSFDALIHGVPVIVLGDAVTRNISSNLISLVDKPYLASMNERLQLLNNLAYCQFTPDEFKSGEAWSIIRDEL